MQPLRTQTINGHFLSEYYDGRKHIVLIDGEETEHTWKEAVQWSKRSKPDDAILSQEKGNQGSDALATGKKGSDKA